MKAGTATAEQGAPRPPPAAAFSVATSVELALMSTRDRLVYASLYAVISLLIQPWIFPAVWITLIFVWELGVRVVFDRVVLKQSAARAEQTYAAVNFVGSCLYQVIALLGLASGSAIGVAIATTWLAGSFMSNFIYFGANRRLLLAVLGPGIAAALIGPFLASGLQLQSAVISTLIMAGLISARGFALDHQTLLRTLADRQLALSDVESKLAVAIEASGDGLFDISLEGRANHVSATWLAILGYAPGEAPSELTEDWRSSIHPDDVAALQADYAAHFRGETPHTTSEHRMRCKDGQYKWVLARGRLVERTADGKPGRIVGTMMDLTARKALEQQLETARDVAEGANHAKGVFLANMSHEIRTPLNGVIGTAGALARRPLAVEEREMVALIQSSGQTLDRLLSDILDQAKIEAGQFELLVAPFDLHDTIETAAELMRARADEKGVGFRVVYADTARGVFSGDAIRIRQIVSNLASNAIKFTASGEVRILVNSREPERLDEPSVLEIKVVDSGIGFDPEAAKRLFTRFTQADGSISRQFGGTGLGLSICKTLVELMQGEIAATSEPGTGSTFTVEIPLTRTTPLAEYDARRADPRLAEPSADAASMGQLRVLLAEDHPTNQRVVQLILEPSGVDLTIVSNGREAVEIFQPNLFDLILMDMQMPVMDGLTATREIRRRERELGATPTPIAMLTANAMCEHRDQATAAGADHLIAKPITPESLTAGVEFALAKAEAAAAA
ncbi:MAG: PAS domain-containing hybrid sensor histidine kinase/response regulator [Phenylobacterium sp.]|uniref:hybrid sensor histidine kinase/response regulator n=1 Tax=Phenylobacterium sp. TaxID=1871053 RepID=UPI001213E5D9|nr:PAS domain-containing hybrid sensor histidine kinase/response regulator [Phenylobacterium sp.]TAJ72406.1 MAG: PAS domain-containing hybrid sensor histidine kinase/response regulator [Phenylobacterium sp.]